MDQARSEPPKGVCISALALALIVALTAVVQLITAADGMPLSFTEIEEPKISATVSPKDDTRVTGSVRVIKIRMSDLYSESHLVIV